MRKLLLVLAAIGILTSTLGCANGPIRSWFRGSPCNTCTPPLGQPLGENLIGGCNTGTCSTGTCGSGTCSSGTVGSGFLGGVFTPNQTTVAPPVSLPASSFGEAPAAIGSAPEYYGNTKNVGKIELPPFSPYD